MSAAVPSAEASTILGLLAAAGKETAPVFADGAPAELLELTDGQIVHGADAAVAAAKDAQGLRNGPLVVLAAETAAPTVRTLLDQPDIGHGRLLILGTGAAEGRASLEAIPWLSWTRVRYVDLEYVPPRLAEGPGLGLEGGLGLVVIEARPDRAARRSHFAPMAQLLPGLNSNLLPARASAEEIEAGRRAQAELAAITASTSWRITAPLRAAKNAIRRRS